MEPEGPALCPEVAPNGLHPKQGAFSPYLRNFYLTAS
jgi:hypothetical protein